MRKSTGFIKNPDLKVVLALDEARALLDKADPPHQLSFYHGICSALRTLPAKHNFFATFSDTTSNVADFGHPAQSNPDQILEDKSFELFAPIYQIDTIDSMLRCAVFGQWIRSAQQNQILESKAASDLTEIALQALLCCSIPPQSQNLSQSQILALLGSTIQPKLHMTASLNSKLIASHGAVCYHISQNRKLIESGYPSQFPFATAANAFLASNDTYFIACIDAMTLIVRQGRIPPGQSGELASRIILLRAMHNAMRISNKGTNIPYGCLVPLVNFLKVLTGLEETELQLGSISDEHRARLLRYGHIFWNHFNEIEYTPNSANFLELLYQGLAVQCKPLQTGLDQLFTIYLKSDPESHLTEENVTFCGIQVKNRISNINVTSAARNWTPQRADIKLKQANPYLIIFISLKTKPRNDTLLVDPARASLLFHGLNSIRCLTPDMVAALEQLIITEQQESKRIQNRH
ncbi:hypothetical protein PSTG_14395 [Puccinia striiformis f. sp. tritici PST-78]|uniref:Uncharacterized protein n=1 Tax=Puccinia striiformis f. sp. tritici PST-78 TaxID=1165861 RepID=A0A0L0UYX4_9BASI|nr:hypothetical protein PSTG_14395 [Puccinia striiformis f. sp. tritici PST-78]